MYDLPSSPIDAEHGNSIKTSTLADMIIDMGVDEFKALSELQRMGWKNEGMDNYFEHQRSSADNAGHMLERRWFGRMKHVLQEIDMNTQCIQRTGVMRFLDLGCCPGGFTSYILDRNSNATGYGISLDVEKGGHPFHLEKYHRARFQLLFADLTYFQLGPSVDNDPMLRPLPFRLKPRSFHLVVLDGHQLRTHKGARSWDIDRLLISQLILALEAVRDGGTIVIKLSRLGHDRTAKVLCMLDMVCGSLSTCKPESMHAIRGTFYAIAKEVGQGADAARLPAIIEGLRELWFELTFGGENGDGRFMLESDLDFVVSKEELIDHYLDRLIELGRGVWMTQARALHCFLQRKGIVVDDVVLPAVHD